MSLALPSAPVQAQDCNDPAFCPPDTAAGCWSEELEEDICNPTPPVACKPGPSPAFTFVENKDRNDKGQIFALNNANSTNGGTLHLPQSGYYDIFNNKLS